LLSGKYRPSRGGSFGEGRLETVKGSSNPTFDRFNDRNFAIVAELERVAAEAGRPMSQVAIHWVANRPGVASVIVGATKLSQLEDNLQALDFTLAPELLARLDRVSRPDPRFPYVFFGQELQGMVHGGSSVGDKPATYHKPVLVTGGGAGVTA
jgi:aryl-alcohol dehydrogenase-like predicted oxidoreductase